MSAAAWAFIFFRKKTNQKKLHSANSRSQNSIYQLVKIKILDQNFDRVQTVLSDIRNHYFTNIFSRMTVNFYCKLHTYLICGLIHNQLFIKKSPRIYFLEIFRTM
ncbi:hypothetical protein EGI26_07875 [Lacihabitans sp. CCS-44]|nr:hypothetical protein [Lacihabitans sp. CCS-44]